MVEKLTGYPLYFHSIHGTGAQGIVVDMDMKQYGGMFTIYFRSICETATKYLTGLCDYLHEADPEKRPASEQGLSLILFCQIHFKRGVKQALQNTNHNPGAGERMISILYAQTEDDYLKTLDFIICKYKHF